MKKFCTTCDYNYLPKGLSLYESLNTLCLKFELHWLCIDDKTFDKLQELNLPNVIAYKLSSLEQENEDLIKAKDIEPRLYGNKYSQYCWCLTPYFINYILKGLKENEKLLYCDADIYFYYSPEIVFDSLDKKSVTIHTHRFSGEFDDENPAGWYNVGVIGFKKDTIGIDVSESWKGWLLDSSNPYYEKYGICGDQKYLNVFRRIWGENNICVFDEEFNILHLAAWCTHNDLNQSPLFYHFSHFVTDFSTWSDSLHGEWNPSQYPHIKPLYEDYFNVHIKVKEKYL
jgi:hypothetical protein